jgi:hypothetical protein
MVSIFNDKELDLIGEAFVNLQKVVILGGGQNDLWHKLHYKGKYAGEVRIKITYKDNKTNENRGSGSSRRIMIDSGRGIPPAILKPKQISELEDKPSESKVVVHRTGRASLPSGIPEIKYVTESEGSHSLAASVFN